MITISWTSRRGLMQSRTGTCLEAPDLEIEVWFDQAQRITRYGLTGQGVALSGIGDENAAQEAVNDIVERRCGETVEPPNLKQRTVTLVEYVRCALSQP